MHPACAQFQRFCAMALAEFVGCPEATAACRDAVPAIVAAMASHRHVKDLTDAGTKVLLAFADHPPARRAAADAVPSVYRQMLNKLGALPGDTDALLKAAYEGNAAEARELLDRGVRPGNRETKASTPMQGGQTLFASTTPWVGTALHVAARHGKLEVLRLLLARGADVDTEAPFTQYSGGTFGVVGTPLAAAVYGGSENAVAALLEAGAAVDEHAAALAADKPAISALLKAAAAAT